MRFNASDIDKYGGQGGGGFFSLKNDGDKAKVRFMYDKVEDVEGYAVHVVDIDGRKRNVNCLREYRQPIDDCPLCRDGNNVRVRLFIPVYNIAEDKVQIWERGKTFMRKLSGLMARYPKFVSHVFEIERNGEIGDMQTTYEVYEVDQDDTRLKDLPEVPEIIGGVVLDKSADDMEYYLEEGEFPPDDEDDEPVKRRTKKNREDEDDEDDYDDDEEAEDDEEDERPRRRRETRKASRTERRTSARTRNKKGDF